MQYREMQKSDGIVRGVGGVLTALSAGTLRAPFFANFAAPVSPL
jgi:hypothetical protein